MISTTETAYEAFSQNTLTPLWGKVPNAALSLFAADCSTALELPLAGSPVSAGFPSPAEDYIEMALDLNKELIKNPEATFYARVRGHSMKDACIQDGDLLVIDKAQEPKDGCVAVCAIDGEFTLKRLAVEKDGIYLMPANDEFKPIKITEENDFLVWGIVAYVVHKVR